MSLKAGFLFIALLIGSYAFPVQNDMSIFFHTDLSARIVGGTAAGRVPYVVALTSGVNVRNLACGGSLVTTRHVLTAAHCVIAVLFNGNLLSSLRGIVGSDRFTSGGTAHVFTRYNYHPSYTHSTIKNDIGFLVTSNNVVLSNRVSLIPLNLDFVGAGVPTMAFGWGSTLFTPFSQVLLQMTGSVVDSNTCVTRVAQRAQEVDMTQHIPHVDPRVEICSFSANGRGVCSGDSGSPLIRTDRNHQIGIVSWGIPCARNVPDVFTRISAFRSYINQNIS